MVSVIIPNYNHARFLQERIESVLNQSFTDIEVILLDDCSSDNSREIIKSYEGHPKVSHVILNDENSGSTFKQWHKGFNLARGEYIWIAESDDVAHPDFLKTLLHQISGDKDIVLAASAITLIDEDSNVIGYASISKSNHPRKYDSKQFIRENLLLGNHLLNASSAIFRKDVLRYLPDTYSRLTASGDYLFWVEIAHRGKVIEVPDKLDYFRRSSLAVTPRLYGNGRAFEEAHIVFNRLLQLGYLNGLYKNIVVGFRLDQIRQSTKFNDEAIRLHCKNIWEHESKYPLWDHILFLAYGMWRKIKRLVRNLR